MRFIETTQFRFLYKRSVVQFKTDSYSIILLLLKIKIFFHEFNNVKLEYFNTIIKNYNSVKLWIIWLIFAWKLRAFLFLNKMRWRIICTVHFITHNTCVPRSRSHSGKILNRISCIFVQQVTLYYSITFKNYYLIACHWVY